MFEKDGLGDLWSQTVGKVAGNVAAETSRVVHNTAAEIGRAAPVKAIAKTAVGKEIARVGTRVTKTVVQPLVTAATHGDIIKATALLNPAAIGLKSVGANKSLIDAANALTPVSATLIQDKRLKEKVLGAYAVAAVVGAGVLAAGAYGPAAGVGSEIPGTGMTAAQMSAAGASDAQIAEITAAANAPGGIMSGANAALLTDIGGTVPSGVSVVSDAAQAANIANQANQGITAAQVAQGAQLAQTGIKIDQALNPKGSASGSAPGGNAPESTGIFGIPTNYLMIGGGLAVVLAMLALKTKKKSS